METQCNQARFEDMGDGVVCLRFTQDTVDAAAALWAADGMNARMSDATAFVVAGCPTYDMQEIQAKIAEEDWAGLETVAAGFQHLTNTIRTLEKPVVAAVSGTVSDIALDIAICADGVCAGDATFGYALKNNRFTPMGGGITELVLRTYAIGADVMGCDMVPFLKRICQQLYMGKPCAGISEAAQKGLLLNLAGTCSPETLLGQAKAKALFLAAQGYIPPTELREIFVTGTTGVAAMQIPAINMQQGGFISHELYHMAADVAGVMGGGDVPKGTLVAETQLLKLERQAFINACKRQVGKEQTA